MSVNVNAGRDCVAHDNGGPAGCHPPYGVVEWGCRVGGIPPFAAVWILPIDERKTRLLGWITRPASPEPVAALAANSV